MNGKHFVGEKVSDFEKYNEVGPITGITLLLDDKNAITAGDQNGFVMEIECPYGTQEMADNILSSVKDHVYKGFRADNTPLPVNAELGDAVTVGDVYSMLAYRSITFGPGHFSEIAAPGENEMDHEYHYETPIDKINRKIAETRSSITKTAEEIMLEVSSVEGNVSTLSVSVSGISSTVSGLTNSINGLSNSISTIDQRIDSITLSVSNGTKSSWISITGNGIQSQAQEIKFTGNVVFESDLSSGTTTIDGDCIKTGTISAKRIELGEQMTVYEDLEKGWPGGYFGSYYSFDYNGNKTVGVVMQDSTLNNVIAVTSGGARLTSQTAEVVTAVNITLETSNHIDLKSNGFYSDKNLIVSSDKRKKTDIRYDLSKIYLPIFDFLKPCSFLWKYGDKQRHLGFIAQEYKDAEKNAGISFADSVIIGENNGFYGLAYEEFIPILVAKIQQIDQEIKELKTWKS